jgi:hypothetical protein
MTANRTLSIEEGKELLRLCRLGKLYEVEAWISTGKSTQVPKVLKKAPLRTAIDIGFHSLVQLLAVHENNPAVLNDALGLAVELRSVELAQLLLNNGAEIRGIPLISVLRSWDPVMIQLFLDVRLDEVDDPECQVTAFQEAASGHQLQILKRLKPDPERDDLADLLFYACAFPKTDVIQYLLEIGAKVNDKENGGSSALDQCLGFMHLDGANRRVVTGKRSTWDVRRTMEAISTLTQHGAVWHPDDMNSVNWVRKTLLESEPEVAIKLLKVLRSNNACPKDTLKELLSSPRLREHIAPQKWWLTSS